MIKFAVLSFFTATSVNLYWALYTIAADPSPIFFRLQRSFKLIFYEFLHVWSMNY